MTEVLIIGGGVFGLSTALSLARGEYRSKPEKILVIGIYSHRSVGIVLVLTYFHGTEQTDPLILPKKMPLALTSTRSSGLITRTLFMLRSHSWQ